MRLKLLALASIILLAAPHVISAQGRLPIFKATAAERESADDLEALGVECGLYKYADTAITELAFDGTGHH